MADDEDFLYDEFGNYIGPAQPDDGDAAEPAATPEQRGADTLRDASGLGDDDEDDDDAIMADEAGAAEGEEGEESVLEVGDERSQPAGSRCVREIGGVEGLRERGRERRPSPTRSCVRPSARSPSDADTPARSPLSRRS